MELGAELAATARRNLAGHDSVHVVTAKFESWQPQAGQRFDLVYAATAWHWIDPEQRDRLYGEIRRRLATRSDGLVRRHRGAPLTTARRQEPQAGA